MNHESVSWSHKPQICNTSIFHKSFFAKCDNFKIISAGDIYLSICLELNEWNWLMKDKNATNFFIHYLDKFVLKKKKNCFCVAGFLGSGAAYPNINTLWMHVNWTEKKTFFIFMYNQ